MTEDSATQASASRDVFVSYASPDAAVANSMVEDLEQHGIRCWIAPRDVRPGTEYADAIVAAINESKAVVLILSGSAMASAHVGREIERAASKHKPVIAFRIDAAPLSRSLEYFLSNSQWIDVPALGMPAALSRLSDSIGQASILSSSAIGAAASGAAKPDTVTGRRPGGVSKRAMVATVILVGAAIAVGLGIHSWPMKGQAPTVAAISQKSIAVLPFADMSEKHDQEYFSDGLAEELAGLLGKIPGMRVIGTTSSFRFKQADSDTRSIAHSLGASYLVQGGVRRSGDHIRVTAKLLDGRSGEQKWSDSYDRDVRDVLKVQEDIATGLARALQITVDTELDVKHSVKSPEAYDLYLRGVTALDKGTHPAVDEAVANFEQALSLDPDYAAAAVGLAEAYMSAGSEAWILPGEAYPKARQWAELALRLDPKFGEPHADLAWIHVAYDWDWAAAQSELALAQKLGAMLESIEPAAALAMNAGHCDQAAQLFKPVLVTDPLNPEGYNALGYLVYLRCGRYADAALAMRRALEISPGFSSDQYFLSVALMLQGKFDEAMAAAAAQSAESGQCEGKALVYFAMGRKAESDAMLKKCTANEGGYWASEIARIHAFRGEPDQAMEWLERAYAQHDEDLFFIKGDPLLKSLEGDPRYKAFLRKMNLPE